MKIGKTPIFFLKKFHLLPGRSVRRVAADDYSLIWPLFQVGNFLVNCSKLCQNVYIYIYIYIGCTSANYTFLNASFHYYFKGPSVSSIDNEGYEIVTQKVKSGYYKLYRNNSMSFNSSSNAGNIFQNWVLIHCIEVQEKKKKFVVLSSRSLLKVKLGIFTT